MWNGIALRVLAGWPRREDQAGGHPISQARAEGGRCIGTALSTAASLVGNQSALL